MVVSTGFDDGGDEREDEVAAEEGLFDASSTKWPHYQSEVRKRRRWGGKKKQIVF